MRVYTRSENQSLVIGHNVSVTVLRVYPDHVRIGIRLPRECPRQARCGLGEDDSEFECFDNDQTASDEMIVELENGQDYWETDLFLPDGMNLEDVELELSVR
jgi:hypothetical protein